MTKKLLLLLVLGLSLTLGIAFGRTLVEAKDKPKEDKKVYWCHCEVPQDRISKDVFQCQTLHISKNALKENGHLEHENDYEGECAEPTPTPTPTPTPEPEYCEDEKALNYKEEGECEYEQEEPTPTPTPTPKEEPKTNGGGSSGSGSASAPTCSDTPPAKEAANFHIYRKGGSIIAKWWPTEGNKAHVYYKVVGTGGWQHSLRDIDNTGYVELTVDGQDYTFALQQANGCAGGPLTPEVVDGDTTGWVLFR